MQGLQVRNYKMKNEKLQPTNNNVSKFISNKSTCKYCKNLQIANYKIASLQIFKLQITNSQITILQIFIKI